VVLDGVRRRAEAAAVRAMASGSQVRTMRAISQRMARSLSYRRRSARPRSGWTRPLSRSGGFGQPGRRVRLLALPDRVPAASFRSLASPARARRWVSIADKALLVLPRFAVVATVVTDDPMRRRSRNAVARRLLSRLPHAVCGRYPHPRPAPVGAGGQPRAWPAVLAVSRRRSRKRTYADTGPHARPAVARWSKSIMPMEFLNGRPLSPEELEMIRRKLESSDDIAAVDDEIRGIVARNWPHLLSKLPPEED
jgi:hypothetical protein